jgi:DNA-binding NarL/FixJ family response regulator
VLDAYAHQFPDAPATPEALGDPLTERDRSCRRSRAGCPTPQQLVVPEAIVKSHVGRILFKLDLRDRVQAVIFAYETGLVRASRR